jgi:hypothetical protein
MEEFELWHQTPRVPKTLGVLSGDEVVLNGQSSVNDVKA